MENIYKKEIEKKTFYLKMEIGIKKKYLNVAVKEIVYTTSGTLKASNA